MPRLTGSTTNASPTTSRQTPGRPTGNQPGGKHLRHRPAASPPDQGLWLAKGLPGDGVQMPPIGPTPPDHCPPRGFDDISLGQPPHRTIAPDLRKGVGSLFHPQDRANLLPKRNTTQGVANLQGGAAVEALTGVTVEPPHQSMTPDPFSAAQDNKRSRARLPGYSNSQVSMRLASSSKISRHRSVMIGHS